MTLLLLFNQPLYHQVLLDTSQRLITEGEYQVGVVTAQMACEVYTEQIFAEMFKKKKLVFLEEAVGSLLPNYNLGNDKVRKFYTALSGDAIQDAPFWLKFKEGVTLRNGAVHRGSRITKQQAEDSYQAFEDLINHVKAVLQAL